MTNKQNIEIMEELKKTIALKNINKNTVWIETKIEGDKRGWLETKRNSFTGKRKILGLLGEVISMKRYWGNCGKCEIRIADPKLVSARVLLWNRETKENEYYKILF